MSLRDRFRSILRRTGFTLGGYSARDHPADGGITGEEYPERPEE